MSTIDRFGVFDTSTDATPKCAYCGTVHAGRCPLVAAIDYYPDGTVKRVEFVKPEPIVQGPASPFVPLAI